MEEKKTIIAFKYGDINIDGFDGLLNDATLYHKNHLACPSGNLFPIASAESL
jgi:hypothetical protein